MGAAVVIILRKQRETIEIFEGARATSAATARVPDELGLDADSLVFNGLVERAILRPAGNGRYYLDEPSWIAHNTMRRRRVLALLGVVAVVLAGVVGVLVSRL